MSINYSKVVIYGSLLEIYQYELNPPQFTEEQRAVALFRRKQSLSLRRADTERSEEQNATKRKDNVRRASVAFRRLVIANLTGSAHPVFVSLTYSESEEDPRRAYKDFRSFAKRINTAYGKEVRYIAVPEFQKRGSLHFHALFWGLPPEVASQERRTRSIARIWGKGFVDIKETDGHHKIASYMAKYMTKGFLDSRLFQSRAYLFSRNCLRPVVDKNALVSSYIFEHDLSTKDPLHDQEFQSLWLGKGRFRLYAI